MKNGQPEPNNFLKKDFFERDIEEAIIPLPLLLRAA
jgi:hypothetical protein